MTPWLISIPLAYVLGSIPFGYLLVSVFRKQDIRAIGSGNIGATNVARSGAKGLGILTLLLDLGKGATAVLLAFTIAFHTEPAAVAHGNAQDIAAFAAVAAVLGHVFPVWLRFHGGKGVATALGVFVAIVPGAAICVVGVFLVVLLLTRYVSLASILAAVAFPIFGLHFVHHISPIILSSFLIIPVIVIAKHHENIRRLLAGTENRFGAKAAPRVTS